MGSKALSPETGNTHLCVEQSRLLGLLTALPGRPESQEGISGFLVQPEAPPFMLPGAEQTPTVPGLAARSVCGCK